MSKKQLEIPKIGEAPTPKEMMVALISLDEQIEHTSDLIGEEKKKVSELLSTLESLLHKYDYNGVRIPKDVEAALNDLKKDLESVGVCRFEISEVYKLKPREQNENSPELARSINMIYLFVVNDGVVKPVVVTKEDLIQNPILDIDGHIADIYVLGTKMMKVQLSGKKGEAIQVRRTTDDKYIKLDFGGYGNSFSVQDFVTSKHSFDDIKRVFFGDSKPEYGAVLPGRYFTGVNTKKTGYMGNPFTEEEENTLTLFSGEQKYELPIIQKTKEKYAEKEGIPFIYRGNNIERVSGIDNIDRKLQAIAQAVKNIETMFGTKIIESVNILDFEQNNAFARDEPPDITVLIKYLRESSQESLKTMVEHELLHIVVYNLGLTEDRKIRTAYADFLGASGVERKRLIRLGYTPFGPDRENLSYNSTFFAFVDEAHFLKDADTGHSFNNIYEFTTSFIHSLMYVERFKANLLKRVKVRYGPEDLTEKTFYLSRNNCLDILGKYKHTILLMLEVTKANDKSAAITELLERGLREVEKLEKEFAYPKSK